MMTSESGDDSTPTSRRRRIFLPSAPRAEKSSNNHKKRRVHHNSAKHLRCTTAPSSKAPRGDRRHSHNCAGNANTRLQSGRTGTSQCSPYQLKLRGNGTVGTDDCDHERHAGVTKNTRLRTKQTSEAKKKVLLMELQDKFHLRKKNLISKEGRTSGGRVLQKKGGWQ